MDILSPNIVAPPFSSSLAIARDSVAGQDGTYSAGVALQQTGLGGTKAAGIAGTPDGVITPLFLNWPFSVDGWVNTFDNSLLQDFISSESATGGFGIRIQDGNYVAFVSNGITAPQTVPVPITENVWHYFGLTFDGTTAILYLDGVEAGRVGGAYAVGSNTVSIGFRGGFGDRGLDGLIELVGFYSSILTPTDFAERYAVGVGPPPAPVLGTPAPLFAASESPNRMLYGTNANSMNQRVGIEFAPGTGSDQTGVVLRYLNDGAYLIAFVTASGTFVVGEIIGGEGSVLLNVPVTLSANCSMQVEVVGNRLRWWFDAYPELQDRPPDGAVDLAGDYDATYNGWGVFIQGYTGTITRFVACELPSAIMPPPMLQIGDAPGRQLAPAVLEFTTDLPTTGKTIEWEMLPDDPADFPEAYRCTTPSSVTSQVIYVRQGYTYQARARLTQTPWSEYLPIVSGNAAIGDAWDSRSQQLTDWSSQDYATNNQIEPVLAAYNFPSILPDYVLEGTEDVGVKISTTNTGQDTTSSNDRRPRRSFTLKFENRTFSDYQTLIDFFEFAQAKELAFNWTHPITAEQFVLRFDADDYERTDKDQADQTTSAIVSIAFACTEAAPAGTVAPTIAFSLNIDPSIFS